MNPFAFWVVFFCLMLAIPISASQQDSFPQFDYLGTSDGSALIRGKCEPLKNSQSILCNLIEVKPLTPEHSEEELKSLEEAYFHDLKKWLSLKKAPTANELRKVWERQLLENLKKDGQRFGELKTAACKEEARDFFKIRGAYNETYDAFLEKAKRIQNTLCQATSPDAFIKAKLARWDLATSICEIEYDEYHQSFIKRRPNVWISNQKLKTLWSNCYELLETEIDCSKSSQCAVYRTHQKRKPANKEMKHLPDIVWLVNPRAAFNRDKSNCSSVPDKLVQHFEKAARRTKPKDCEYILDRQRASHCCAYQ